VFGEDFVEKEQASWVVDENQAKKASGYFYPAKKLHRDEGERTARP